MSEALKSTSFQATLAQSVNRGNGIDDNEDDEEMVERCGHLVTAALI